MNYTLLLGLLVFLSLFGVRAAENCGRSPQCSCEFGADGELPVAASGSDERNIGIAAATGALGSIVLAGGGFALWHFIKSRSKSTLNNLYERPASNDSSTGSWMNGKNPPTPRENPTRGSSPFSSQDNKFGKNYTSSEMSSSKTTNIYRMGRLWT